ncbi:MAG TPA: hypothetical protein VE990_01920 [Acidimicrobiales bacterium]|nr:hypothetical protein [Acidimicrobiales bacterium]
MSARFGAKKLGAAAGMVGVAALLCAMPARAAFASPSLVLSDNVSGSSSSYTLTFTPSISVANMLLSGLTTVVALPNGGAGSTVSGLSGATVTAKVNTGSGFGSALTLTKTVDSTNNEIAVNLAAGALTGLSGTPVFQIQISGLTNATVSSPPATQNVCLADTLTGLTGLLGTLTNTGSNPGPTSSTLSALTGVVDNTCLSDSIVNQTASGVTAALNVSPVLTMSLDSTSASFNITPTSTGAVASNASSAITIGTNAQSYTLEAVVSGASPVLTDTANSTYTIPLSFQTATGSSPAACNSDGTGSGTFGSNGSYGSLASALTGLTNATVTNVNYCWKVDLTKPVGTYSTTITYLAVPSF